MPRIHSCHSSCKHLWVVLQIGYSSAELAVEWLMAHPEEPAAADAAAGDSSSKGEDEAIKKQLMESLGADEVPKLEVLFAYPHCMLLAGTDQHPMCFLAPAFKPMRQQATTLQVAVTHVLSSTVAMVLH